MSSTQTQPSSGPVTAPARPGLTSAIHVVITSDEDRVAFTDMESGLRDELKPEGKFQELLFRRLLTASWNIERCENAHANLLLSSAGGCDPLTDPALHSTIRLLETYVKRNERSFAQAVKQLREAQAEQMFRQGALTDEEFENCSIPALVPAAKVRKQWADDECARTRSEAALIRRSYDPMFAELRIADLRNEAAAATPQAATTTASPNTPASVPAAITPKAA